MLGHGIEGTLGVSTKCVLSKRGIQKGEGLFGFPERFRRGLDGQERAPLFWRPPGWYYPLFRG